MSQVEERGFSSARGLRPAIDAQYGKVRFITPLQPKQMATTAEPKAPSWMTSFADGVVGFATVGLKIFIAAITGGVTVGAIWVISRLIIALGH